AVLICTMGVLILLLVVISRNIREKAVAAGFVAPTAGTTQNDFDTVTQQIREELGLTPDATSSELLSRLNEEAENFTWLTNEITNSKEKTVEQLNEARARVGDIEQSIKKLVSEVDSLTKSMKSLVENNANPTHELDKLKKELENKEKAKAAAQEELKKLQDASQEKSRSYAIVPYRGPNGTFRRPIYIECRDACVVVQPEGVVLYANDFLTPEQPDNPIEMAVRAVRQYYVEMGQVERDTEPYPLFIVRPTGIFAYEAARRSLRSWKDDFGYELVEDDWNLEYHTPSDELKKRLEEQVEIGRVRQESYIEASLAYGAKNSRKRQFKVGSSGGLQQIGSSGINVPVDRRIGSTSGTQPSTTSNNAVSSNMMPSNIASGNGTPLPSGNGVGNGGGFSGGANGAETSASTGIGSGGGTGIGTGNSSMPVANIPGNTGFSSSAGGAASAGDIEDGWNSSNHTSASLYNTSPQPEAAIPGGVTNQPGNNSHPGNTQAGDSQTGNALSGNTQSGITRQSGSANQAGTNNQAGTDNQFGSTSQACATNQNGTATAPSTANQSGGAASSNSSPTATLTQETGVPSVTFQQAARGVEQPQTSSGTPANQNSKQAGTTKNWGLKNATQAAIAKKKIVHIRCDVDKIVIVKQPGLFNERQIPNGSSSRETAEQFVKAIWDFMETWDSAGENSYWRPLLRVTVTPGAEKQMQQLKAALAESGIEIESK
ncbi:MAG: hypothetical protein ACRC2T_19495, partial [Thermoguttaceae bacterium]